MVRRHNSVHLHNERFPGLYEIATAKAGLDRVVQAMEQKIRGDVIDYALVREDCIQPYIDLLDVYRAFAMILFTGCPEGQARFEVTYNDDTQAGGMRMFFNTTGSADGQTIAVLDMQWVYDFGAREVIYEKLTESNNKLKALNYNFAVVF